MPSRVHDRVSEAMRVLAALSGGVDSAVACALALEAGHEVVGVHLALAKDEASVDSARRRGCGSKDDVADAARVAQDLGIDFEVWDVASEFRNLVMQDFLTQYRAGLTPNPCVRCNQYVKFRELLRRAFDAGFDKVATGHYARIVSGSHGWQLHRAVNLAKDQSYLLAVTGRKTLERVLFPLGEYSTKDQVRAEAKKRGLKVAQKPDSFDICFIPDGDTQGFLTRHLGAREGEVVDAQGKVVGQHQGYFNFTIGQRKGLGTIGPDETGNPRYVLGTEPQTNRVIIGDKQLLRVGEIHAEPVVWMSPPQTELSDVTVQFRAHGTQVGARIEFLPLNESATSTRQILPENASPIRLRAYLEQPVQAVAPGQSLVVYRGTEVLAQANIEGTA